MFLCRENVELSPNKKAMPIIVSNSTNIHGCSSLIFAWRGCGRMVMMGMVIAITTIRLFFNFYEMLGIVLRAFHIYQGFSTSAL